MKRFTIANEGYNIEEVNRFIDIVIKRLEKLNNDNLALIEENEKLKKKIDDEKVSEAKLGDALLAAQNASDKIKSLAREEADLITREARNNANAIIHEALLTAEESQKEAMLLRKNIVVYKNRVKNIIKSQLEIAEELDKYDLDV